MFKYLRNLFSLKLYQASNDDIHEGILQGINIRGGNLIILFCAIFIASLGLNTNSTAVIIGAMLISPLMSPIIGIGYGIGTHDYEIIKKSLKLLGIEILISLITSTIYFSLTPLKDAGSEILSRTTPTIWDVMIAFIGGLAGVIGITRKEKTNVIPGVAIATALMPPLCTAGYGLATFQIEIFLGASYLFLINSIFITLSTFLVTKILKLPIKNYVEEAIQQKAKKTIYFIVTITVIPSIFIAYNIVRENITNTNINQFVKKEIKFQKSRVIGQYYDAKEKKLEVVILGETVSKDVKKFLQERMKEYNLKDIQLELNQGVSAEATLEEIENFRKNFIKEIDKKEKNLIKLQEEKLKEFSKSMSKISQIDSEKYMAEIKVIFPKVSEFTVSRSLLSPNNTEVLLVMLSVLEPLTDEEINKMNNLFKIKSGIKDIYIFTKTSSLNKNESD